MELRERKERRDIVELRGSQVSREWRERREKASQEHVSIHTSNGQKECTKSKRCRNIKHTCGEVLVLCIVIELVQLVPMGLMDWMGAKVPLDLLVSVETRE